MAGLFAYAAAGAISGLGNALVEQARRQREEALQQLAESQRRGPGGGGRAFRGGGGGGSSRSPQVFGEYPGEDGILYGRTRSGEMVPYTMPDGSPMRVTDGERRGAAAPAGEPPKVMDTGPTMGAPPNDLDGRTIHRPRTPDEAAALPSGSLFYDDKGVLKVRP